MAAGKMVSRAVTQIPESKNAFRVWLEKILRGHYLDIKRIYNRQIATNNIELVKPNNELGDDGNAKLLVDSNGDVLIQVKVSGTWTDTGWVLKGS